MLGKIYVKNVSYSICDSVIFEKEVNFSLKKAILSSGRRLCSQPSLFPLDVKHLHGVIWLNRLPALKVCDSLVLWADLNTFHITLFSSGTLLVPGFTERAEVKNSIKCVQLLCVFLYMFFIKTLFYLRFNSCFKNYIFLITLVTDVSWVKIILRC